MYTVFTMNYLGRTIVLSLVIALVSFAGSFCLRPMMVQAASADIAGVSLHTSDANSGGCVSEPNAEISNKVVCTSDCVTTTPQTIVAKKVSIDGVQSFIADLSDVQNINFSESFFGAAGFSGTPPPSPDILSSVYKKE